MKSVLELTQELVRCPSLTPNEAGCFEIVSGILSPLGFTIERLDKEGVSNLYATHGQGAPLFLFNGHVDVVPPGPVNSWTSAPFEPAVRDGVLYGRGVADMKASIAAMTLAAAQYVESNPDHPGTVALLFTSDEEGPGIYGTVHGLRTLMDRGVNIDHALVGEPTSEEIFGDRIKIGRRGSLSGNLLVKGKQGHVAYPDLAINPIHLATPFLSELVSEEWDQGSDSFLPTSLQISNIHAGTGAGNVIPGDLSIDFNLRYSPELTVEDITGRIEKLARNFGLDFEVTWNNSANPFLTHAPEFVDTLTSVVEAVLRVSPQLGTGGGTSDARFFGEFGIPVAEFGPINKSIHAIDECVQISELEPLVHIYQQVLAQALSR